MNLAPGDSDIQAPVVGKESHLTPRIRAHERQKNRLLLAALEPVHGPNLNLREARLEPLAQQPNLRRIGREDSNRVLADPGPDQAREVFLHHQRLPAIERRPRLVLLIPHVAPCGIDDA